MRLKTKALLWCAVIAGPLFAITVFEQGINREGYNSLRYPLSSLAIGPTGWVQVANFVVTGILMMLFSLGLRQVYNTPGVKFRGPLWVMMVGVGLLGAGIFSTDPVYGYPAGEPLHLAQFTPHGHLHDAFSILVFVFWPMACFVFRKRFAATGEHPWAAYCRFSGYAMIVTFVLAAMGFKQLPVFVDFAGLSQRLCVCFGICWTVLLALHLLKSDAKEV